MAVGSFDGTIRIWDIEGGNSANIAWGTSTVWIPFQDDPSAASFWFESDGTLFEIPLELELWVERACGLVARDFTQEEWDRL